MAQSYYKIAGTTNPQTDWRTYAVLGKDKDGNERRVSTVEAQQLTSEEKSRLEESGLVLESVSADEAKELADAASQPVGSDVAGSAPVFNTPQSAQTDQGDEGKDK